jgi:hypothetical protein
MDRFSAQGSRPSKDDDDRHAFFGRTHLVLLVVLGFGLDRLCPQVDRSLRWTVSLDRLCPQMDRFSAQGLGQRQAPFPKHRQPPDNTLREALPPLCGALLSPPNGTNRQPTTVRECAAVPRRARI